MDSQQIPLDITGAEYIDFSVKCGSSDINTLEGLQNHITFWSGIMKEHMEFYHYMVVGYEQIRNQIAALHVEWKHLLQYLSNSNAVNINVINTNTNAINMDFIDTVLELIDQTLELKDDIINRLEHGEWLGPYISFVKESRKEAQYFRDLITRKITRDWDINYWIQHSADHTRITAHMQDPSQPDLVQHFFREADKFDILSANTQTPEGVMINFRQALAENNSFIAELRNDVDHILAGTPPYIYGIVSPKLMAHTLKEVAYGYAKVLTYTKVKA